MKMRDNYDVNNFLAMTTWRIRFLDGDIKAEIPSWNNFLRSLLRFVVVRSNHDERLVRICLPLKPITSIELWRFRSIFLILRWQKKKKEDTRKNKFILNSAYKNVGRSSLNICSQTSCRVFACAVIHMIRQIGLDVRFGAIRSVGTIWMKNNFWIYVMYCL
jgi:hypothetical protein